MRTIRYTLKVCPPSNESTSKHVKPLVWNEWQGSWMKWRSVGELFWAKVVGQQVWVIRACHQFKAQVVEVEYVVFFSNVHPFNFWLKFSLWRSHQIYSKKISIKHQSWANHDEEEETPVNYSFLLYYYLSFHHYYSITWRLSIALKKDMFP